MTAWKLVTPQKTTRAHNVTDMIRTTGPRKCVAFLLPERTAINHTPSNGRGGQKRQMRNMPTSGGRRTDHPTSPRHAYLQRLRSGRTAAARRTATEPTKTCNTYRNGGVCTLYERAMPGITTSLVANIRLEVGESRRRPYLRNADLELSREILKRFDVISPDSRP